MWLVDVIARLESTAALRRELPVVVNDQAFVRGGRLVVPWQPHASSSRGRAVREVSTRHSPAVQTVLREARSAIRTGDLVEKLAAEFPGATAVSIESMIGKLMGLGVLVSVLRPPATCTDGLAHLLGALQSVGGEAIRDTAPLVRELTVVHDLLTATKGVAGPVGGERRRAAAARMRALSDVAEQPLMVDVRLDATVVLPAVVAREAEAAAGALLRLTPHPTGHPAWRAYHQLVLERYGPSAVIPVERLVDPMHGIGYPQHFQDTIPASASAGMSGRDERLLALAQQAALAGRREVLIDDSDIDDLAVEGADRAQPVSHVGLCAEVRASTMEDLARGAFTLAVTGVGRSAVDLAGRFLDLLPDRDLRRFLDSYRELPVSVHAALPVQLSFPVTPPSVENVTHTPLVLPEVLSLAEHSDGTRGRISVADLAVVADLDRLYLVSLSRRRTIEPILAHAAAWHTVPLLARFLFEVPRARSAPVWTFSWGAADCLPFLPRLRYGRCVLAPARWRLRADQLPGPPASPARWTAAVTELRDRLGLPATVSVGRADLQLRLNLDQPMDLAVFRDHLRRQPETIVSEAPTPADHGWLGGRAHEIVIPLATTASPARGPTVVTSGGPLPVTGRRDRLLPGGPVLYAKLYAHPDVLDTILLRHLPVLLSTWDHPPMWWFVRYRDPAPHLRLRVHVDDYGHAVRHVGAWVADLRDQGLVSDLSLDSYQRETGRYGSGAAMACVEELFAADSAAVLAQLTVLTNARQVHRHALTAASLVDLTDAMTGDLPAGMRWWWDHREVVGNAHLRDRDTRRQAVSLAGLDRNGPTLDSLPGGSQVAIAWQARRHAAARYVNALLAEQSHVTPTGVLPSLLHLHHVRAHGIGSADEGRTHRLARAVALSWKAHTRHTEEHGR